MLFHKKKLSLFISAISAFGVAALAPSLASAQDTADAATEEVLVTGFRAVQAAALDAKRKAPNSVESIVAEDIGKMPDLNLAESLQRSPGVSITREGGEGRQITVRGLGPEYTRVTLNGMEVPSSAGGTDASGGTNRGRPFDFNVFGSELFSKINIHKSATASVEEGGIASTVELFSHKPLDKPGLTLAGGAQGYYNMNTGDFAPRLSGLYSQSFYDDTVGVLAAINYSDRDVRQDGFGTVRWDSPTNNGQGDFLQPDGGTVVNGTLDSSLEDFNDAYHPRLPRMDSFNRETERLGYALGLQLRPTDRFEFGLNLLSSTFDQDTTSLNYFAMFRNEFENITAEELTLSNNGQYVVGGKYQNVQTRSESRVQYGSSDFTQIVGDFKYEISDTLHLSGLLGNANATYTEDYRRYNFNGQYGSFEWQLDGDENIASMKYGWDITDVANYDYVSGPRIQRDDLERDYMTFKVDLVWDFDDNGSTLAAGLIHNDRNIVSKFYRSAAEGDLELDSSNATTVDRLYGDFADGIDAPSGFPTNWVIADFDGIYSDLGSPKPEFLRTDSNTYDVTEATTGLYAEVNWIYENFTANAGLRYVETEVTAGGYSEVGEDDDATIVYTEESDSYSNVLPSLNLSYEFMEGLRGRLSWSENISRPNPSSLSGAWTAAPLSGTINQPNPGLKPELAESLDLAVEWFFADESYLGLAIFQKEITDAVISIDYPPAPLTQEQRDFLISTPDYDENGNPVNPSARGLDENWEVSTNGNSDEAQEINGWELGYQQVFAYGFGVLANYTNVDSDDLVVGLSENTYNLGAFWENDTFGARLLMNSRDDYDTRVPGRQGNATESTTGPTRFDFAGHWDATDYLTVTLDIINLTDEKERIYVSGPSGNLDLVREYNTTGIEFILGVRAAF